MHGKVDLSRIIWAVCLLVVGVGASGCGKNPPPPPVPPAAPVPAPAAPEPYRSFLGSNAMAHLRPLTSETKVDAEKAMAVWRELLPGMVADEKSQELLRKLHGDLPAELILIDPKQANIEAGWDPVWKAPPPDGAAVAFRVADSIVADQLLKIGSSKVPARAVNYCQVVLIENAATKSAPDMATAMSGMTNVFKDLPPVEPLFLLMEDYVLRHAPGWILIRGLSDEEPELPASVEEQRRDLDQRIRSFAERSKTYYDTLRNQGNAEPGVGADSR